MYFNTTQQKEEALKKFKAKAQTQDDKILEYFKDKKGVKMSPDHVWVHLFETTSTPLTSIRRSINTLTKKGVLEKLDEQTEGLYGRTVYLWILK